mgnify:CR=1 FL=1
MKQVSFKDKDVIAYLNENFVAIGVNTDHEQDLAKKWRIKGLPAVWFLESYGKKVSTVPGYVPPDDLLLMVQYIGTRSYEKNMTFSEFARKK